MKVKKRKIVIILSIFLVIIIGLCIGLFIYTSGDINKTDKIANIEKLIENKNYEKAYKLNNKYFLLSKKKKRNIENKIDTKKEEEYIKNRDIISNIYSERIYSRLIGEFKLCKFYCKDIRITLNLKR